LGRTRYINWVRQVYDMAELDTWAGLSVILTMRGKTRVGQD
jgi:hypothetical protein